MHASSKWVPIIALLGVVCAFHVANALVVGIDFGSDSFKVVLVRTGGIDIVLNEGSGRKTVSSVGYSHHGRLFGDQVQQLYTKNPLLVFNAITQVLGRGAKTVDESWIKDLQDGDHHLYWLRNATISEEALPTLEDEPEMNRVMAKVGESVVFTEEVLAQLLAKARQYASTEAGAPVKDCAITVPYYWSHAQRQALLDAAHLAGFNVLSLLNQNMAIALKFMTDRDFADGPANVVFYDMGTSDLQVSLYRFESVKGKGKTKWVNNATLLATASDSSLGGSTFDSAIVEMWLEKLKEKFGADFEFPPQTITKLQKQAKKTKEILSANKESHVAIESLLADFDFRASITRDEFERRTSQLVERALVPLKTVLDAAGLTPQQIDLFEMFGGGARIPKIQDTLKAFLNPVQLSRHLNTDEAAAFGAAIFAASKSSQHRVKEFIAKDGSNAHFPILVRATDAAGKPLVEDSSETEEVKSSGSELDRVLYKESSRLGSRRTLKIKTNKDIYIELKYPSSVQLAEGVSHLIARYQISFPKDLYTRYNVTDTPTAHIRFELTHSGTVLLTSADASVPIVTKKTIKVKADVSKDATSSSSDSTTTGTTDSSADIDSDAADEASTEATQDSDAEASETTSTDDSTDQDNKKATETTDSDVKQEAEAQEEVTEIREVHSVTTVKLVLETVASLGLSPSQLSEAKRRLKVLDDEEKIRLETEHAKSDLEALIYSIYDKLEDSEIQQFSTSDERSALSDLLGVDSAWLEEDGAEATKSEYNERKNGINKLWSKITLRISEHKDLPIAVEKCQALINAGRETLIKIEATRNVTSADTTPVFESIDKVEEFIKTALETESKRTLTEDPTTLSSQVTSKCREFGWRIDFLLRKPRKSKPVEPKPSSDSEPTSTPNDTSADAETTPQEAESASPESEAETVNKDEL
jgi:hypoxia up-regulated 1